MALLSKRLGAKKMNKVTKIFPVVEVKSCRECPNNWYNSEKNKHYCNPINALVKDSNEILINCPLETKLETPDKPNQHLENSKEANNWGDVRLESTSTTDLYADKRLEFILQRVDNDFEGAVTQIIKGEQVTASAKAASAMFDIILSVSKEAIK
jgi:hypothetical protein